MSETSKAEEKALLVEWALRSSADDEIPADWTRFLTGTAPWEGRVARGLLSTGWVQDPFFVRWLEKLLEGKLVAPGIVDQLLDSRPDEWKRWFDLLTEKGRWEYLSGKKGRVNELVALLEERNRKDWISGAVSSRAIAVDLETDGKVIREVGTASLAGKRLLYSGADDQSLVRALAELESAIAGAMLVVGHNIIDWDWAKLEPRFGGKVQPILWDTLLVQFMLEPWAASHALGGSHHADEDAHESFGLFLEQLEKFPVRVTLALLKGEIRTTTGLFAALADCLPEVGWKSPQAPKWLPDQFRNTLAHRTLLAPASMLPLLGWIPSLAVVPTNTDESLPSEYFELRAAAFEAALTEDAESDAFILALAGVLRMAAREHIRVRRHMISHWLGSRANLQAAIDGTSCPAGSLEPDIAKVAPMPGSCDWYRTVDPDQYMFLFPPAASILSHASRVSRSRLPTGIQRGLGGAVAGPAQQHTVLAQVASDTPEVRFWAWPDAAASRMASTTGDWCLFESATVRDRGLKPLNRSIPKAKQRPRWLVRNESELYPGAKDQASYWKQVLRAFMDLAGAKPRSSVPLLLVSSSRSQELTGLLEEGLTEVGSAEVRLPHHGRHERLLRAASHGHCLVDLVENWQDWRRLAEHAGVVLQPVLEALPILEWYAASFEPQEEVPGVESDDTDALLEVAQEVDDDEDTDGDAGEELGAEEDAVPLTVAPISNVFIPSADILQKIPALIGENLDGWLWQNRFGDYSQPLLVIDPRLAVRRRAIGGEFESVVAQGFRFSREQHERLDGVLEPFAIEREEPPSDPKSMEAFLVDHWNPPDRRPEHKNYISSFREDTQRPAIEAIADRARDVLVALPTGEGKSVLFQVPALCRGLRTRRLTLVISPLKALMRDQVENLARLQFGESVDYLSGDRPSHETEEVFQGLLDHRILLLYIAPERLRNRRFSDALRRRLESDGGFEFIVIDEAHCVNQWGYEFRPDYFYALKKLAQEYRVSPDGDVSPFLLFSATVTASDRSRLQELTRAVTGDIENRALPFVARPDASLPPLRRHISVEPRQAHGSIIRKSEFASSLATRLPVIDEVARNARENRERTGQASAVIVFVSRRDHAEKLSNRVEASGSVLSDYFHAGLDAETRQDVYERFRNGEIDVLFATKAFGMGMDIPHIHWAVHLSPPTYLEDYLQEVGRIGRGREERERAGLNKLEAILLYSDEDFETIREQRARNEVGFRQVADWFEQIRENVKPIGADRFAAVVPDAGFRPTNRPGERRAAANQLRLALHWLEQAQRVEICSMIPGLLSGTLYSHRLEKIQQSQTGAVAEVARVLLSLTDDLSDTALAYRMSMDGRPSSTADRPLPEQEPASSGWLGSVLSGLADFVGFLFGAPESSKRSNSPSVDGAPASSGTGVPAIDRTEPHDAVMNLGNIWADTSLHSIDEVLQCLAELDRLQAVKLQREISFAAKGLSLQDDGALDGLFQAVENAGRAVLQRLGRQGRWTLDFAELSQEIGELSVPETHSKDYQKAFKRGLLYLLKVSGVRIRQRVNSAGDLELTVRLAKSGSNRANLRAESLVRVGHAVWSAFKPRVRVAEKNVSVSTLIRATQQEAYNKSFRESDLRRALGFLAALQLVSVSEPMVPMSYVLEILQPEEPLDDQETTAVWTELQDVNRLSEIRSLAMEVFVHLPREARADFIDGYFKEKIAQDMEVFLEGQLGEIEDVADRAGEEGNRSFIATKREALRATAVQEFFQRYKDAPEEPNQWRAITHPFDRHLLVNAGPGSGKTAVLLARVAHLLRVQQLRPEEILVLSFNRAVVFEIRTKIRELFGRLGYGAYVRRLNIYTFHAFALRHLPRREDDVDWVERRDSSIREIADLLEQDPAFRTQVAGGFRSILMDEFQDVNDDIYRILTALSVAGGRSCGLMVIGDDDQDILGWNRKGEFSDTYFRRFEEDFATQEDDRMVLRVNFRSGREIVEHSQGVLSEFFQKMDGASSRLKKERLRPREEAAESKVHVVGNGVQAYQDALTDAARIVEKIPTLPQQGTLAILCRTNAEVADAYLHLRQAWPGLSVQAASKHRLVSLRNIGLWSDQLQEFLKRSGDQALSGTVENELLKAYHALSIPEVQRSRDEDFTPEQIIKLVRRENRYPRLSHLITFVERQDVDEFERLRGAFGEEKSYAVVSTMHKVKGLEFDRVLILPSVSRFGRRGDLVRSIRREAAEEARLYYVGMTRAKRYLRYYEGHRERAWRRDEPFEGEIGQRRVLEGSPDEVWLGWSWVKTPYNPDPDGCQKYIESAVGVGDLLKLDGVGSGGGKGLLHIGSNGVSRQVGFLAKSVGAGGSVNDLIVSAVIRYRYDPEKEMNSASVASTVEERGWGYVVLAAGTLR